MIASILLLSTLVTSELPVEWSLKLDDEVIRHGDIVYGIAILKNVGTQTIELNALGYGFYTHLFDGKERIPGNRGISTPGGARGAIRTGPKAPQESFSRLIVVAPWGILNRTADRIVRDDLVWPDHVQPIKIGSIDRSSEPEKASKVRTRVPSNSTIEIQCSIIAPYARFDASNKRVEPLGNSNLESISRLKVNGTVNIKPIKNIYYFADNQLERRDVPNLVERSDYEKFDRMTPVYSWNFVPGIAPEFASPAAARELMPHLNPQSRIYRVFQLVQLANEWVNSEGNDRLAFEQAMLDHAAVGGPAERKYLTEKIEQLFATKKFEEGAFQPNHEVPIQ